MFKDKMNAIVEQLRVAEELITQLKPEFEAYIADTSLTLEDRWAIFKSAPAYLRNQGPWVEHLEIGGQEISWYDDFYVDRHQDVDLIEIVEQMYENIAEDSYTTVDYSAEDIKVLQEELLRRNLGGFNNDW